MASFSPVFPQRTTCLIILQEVTLFRPVSIHQTADVIFDADQSDLTPDAPAIEEIGAGGDGPGVNEFQIGGAALVNIMVLGVDIVQRVNRIPLVILSVFQRILIFFDLVGYLVDQCYFAAH